MKRMDAPGLDFQGQERVAVVVAHPDDETLWAGGTLLAHPSWSCMIVTLCRGSDADRAPRFRKALKTLGAHGAMGDLDDGPEQRPLAEAEVRRTLLSLLQGREFDRVLTHGPLGEYTRHRRHEEVALAVLRLWQEGAVRTRSLWMFAYSDGAGTHLPVAQREAPYHRILAASLWKRKYRLVTEVYGFAPTSFEARTTPREEAFWCFTDAAQAADWSAGRPGPGIR